MTTWETTATATGTADNPQAIRLVEAEDIALDLVARLEPACERIEIAGSIRRGKAWVTDIEIVAIPKMETVARDLFGNPVRRRDLLSDTCGMLRDAGVLADRLDVQGRPAWDAKYKRMLYRGVAVDLFAATPDNWGLILLLRTGPAEFNRRLVSSKSFGGYLPFGFMVNDGSLWIGSERVPTPEERDVFNLINLPWMEPEERR